jgi:hypothetical protein
MAQPAISEEQASCVITAVGSVEAGVAAIRWDASWLRSHGGHFHIIFKFIHH